MTGSVADWPDWRFRNTYGHTRRLTRRGWAWEFLRRNPAFRRDLMRALEHARYAERRMDVDVITSSFNLAGWGLLFRKLLEE
ncbi:transcriptional regulator domain-containing protein [Nitratireductor sp. ZSWI3]|uniref:transcriptional regulator domain-containing protein n=1 Tax=Nitratireductor sp. ZSWI3 TaxID=2966359 RepID=UPI00214FF3BE|nr:DUF6499 domain-containing protein [Nitratireductor sp. ZSWI3]MCR4265838.1 DUF6499 domain-containing protein [Nitratireductor sp. ZSWI3]